MSHGDDSKSKEFEDALAQPRTRPVSLRLFIAGLGPRSTQAIADLKDLQDQIGKRCEIEIIDIYENPAAARESQIIAVPTLLRDRPLPKRKLIGAIGTLASALEKLQLTAPLAGKTT